ncbi:hypothetical protein [Yoonia sp. 1_MG-2023]|uniref:hypothetical protein n=1 Tax=Yoonia sp. 1_MG-2023 TaxID=3062659 RepID=UPI0011BE58EC|nr:hypothetical protein [Yoonia sp. 1_MG-2023]
MSFDRNVYGGVALGDLPLDFGTAVSDMVVADDRFDLSDDEPVVASELLTIDGDVSDRVLYADIDFPRLSQLDMNADGVMTRDDIAAFETLYEIGNYDVFQDEDQRSELATCGLPMPNAQDELIVLTASSSNASVNVGFGDHSPASVLVVNIENGTTPLFIVVGARSDMIVLFEGDVSRVRQMIGYGKGIGVSGLPTDAVTVQNEPLCLAFLNSYPPFMSSLDEEWRADFYAYQRARASVLLRTQVEQIVRLENVAHVSVPSYSASDYLEPLDITDQNFNRTMLSYDWSGSELVPRPPRVFDHERSRHFWRLLARNSAGMVYVDPAQILTNPMLVEANQLPATMRLLELVDLGVLSVENANTYRILKPIADLPVLRNRNFIVDAGIEMPTSGIADACVLDDTTGIWHGQDDCPIRAVFTF